MKVLVTGASGFLGKFVCAELRDRGHEVAALVRRPGTEPPDTKAVEGDLTDVSTLAWGLERTRPDCVFHLAAEIASQRSSARIEEVNVEGTRRLVDACLAVDDAPRFMFASTVVTGDAHGAELDETTALPVETAYGRSKQMGERLVRESGLEHVIIRPSHVYGPGGWFVEEFVNRLRQPGRFAVIGKGDNWWDVVRVEDVATAFANAAESAPDGAIYHVVDDEPIRFYDFVALIAQALGVGEPRRIPAVLARLVAGSDPVQAVVRSARSSNRRIKDELLWRPQWTTAHKGVPDAVARLAAGAPVAGTTGSR